MTYVFYDCEEVEAARNGLLRLSRVVPDQLAGDFAVLMEPTGGVVEGGCQGTLRAEITAPGSARTAPGPGWAATPSTTPARSSTCCAPTSPASPTSTGSTYHEGLNAVGMRGGVAGNVIPDECVVTVNYRFAPDRSPEQARAHVEEVFGGLAVTVTDVASGARPGLQSPPAAAFAAAMGGAPRAKLGWTDVARFDALGVPAVNYGPGDPELAHTPHEHVPLAAVEQCEERMRAWLC